MAIKQEVITVRAARPRAPHHAAHCVALQHLQRTYEARILQVTAPTLDPKGNDVIYNVLIEYDDARVLEVAEEEASRPGN